jgi:hypothetical protein
METEFAHPPASSADEIVADADADLAAAIAASLLGSQQEAGPSSVSGGEAQAKIPHRSADAMRRWGAMASSSSSMQAGRGSQVEGHAEIPPFCYLDSSYGCRLSN